MKGVAARFGVTTQCVYKWLKRLGLKRWMVDQKPRKLSVCRRRFLAIDEEDGSFYGACIVDGQQLVVGARKVFTGQWQITLEVRG